MDNLDELLKLVERSAELAKNKTFVANVMETGTDAHKAIECGIRIGEKFRARHRPRRRNRASPCLRPRR